jgi:sec-independent protein translocase protein TatC
MAKYPNEDLFSETTMSFGEHLEELRVCLTRALIGLVLGSLLGLLIGNYVVDLIQRPLLSALSEHYSEIAVLQLQKLYPESELTPELISTVRRSAFIFDELYLERSELARIARSELMELGTGTSSHSGPVSEAETPTAATVTEGAKPLSESGSTSPMDSSEPEKARSELPGSGSESVLALSHFNELIGQTLPPPSLDMVKTRVWRPAKAKLTTLSPHESFMIWMKAGVVTGLLLSSPYIFYQIWLFVAAGLYPHEKRYVYIYLPFSVLLFLSGAATAFFFVFGPVLSFLFSFSRMMNIDPDLRISEVISFVLIMPLGFGISFQLPLVMLFLHRIGIFTISAYVEKWRVSILVIFVISMLLTPADPYSMMLMAVPLTGLYFLGVGLCKWMPRGRNPFDEAYEP